jgi:hypothetical protein
VHPFVALMRRYCIDYTNSHDQSVCDDIMEPDYVVHISGFDLVRDESYKPAVTDIFSRAPGLGLAVHELVVNGDRLCMRFSEHAAMPTDDGTPLACWRGIGLYKWNGRRLTENWVEQDYLSMNRQLATGEPDRLEPPHLDPWVATEAVAPDERAEKAVRAWLEDGDLGDAGRVLIDDAGDDRPWSASVEPSSVVVDDLFSAGSRVPFHVTLTGPYVGGIADVPSSHQGTPVTVQVSGIADVGDDGAIDVVRAVTTRMAVRAQLTGASPI